MTDRDLLSRVKEEVLEGEYDAEQILQVIALAEQAEVLRETLETYAHKPNWRPNKVGPYHDCYTYRGAGPQEPWGLAEDALGETQTEGREG